MARPASITSNASERIAKVKAALPKIFKDFLVRIDFAMAGAVENFIDARGPLQYPSQSKQIGAQSGRLSRSLTPGQVGHISASKFLDSGLEITFGSSIKYAAVHEYGGTINHPGGTDFMIIKGRFIPLRPKHPRSFGKTKPHAITIRERPYLRPGMKYFEDALLLGLLTKIAGRISLEFNAG